jgi:hypothetical protein
MKCEGYSGVGAVLWRAVNLARRLEVADAGNFGVALNGRDGMRESQGGSNGEASVFLREYFSVYSLDGSSPGSSARSFALRCYPW